MLKRIEFEAKSESEALDIAVEKLRLQKEKIKITVMREKKGLFSGSTALFEATPDVNLALEGKTFLEGILQAMDIEFQMELRQKDNGREIHYSIQSNENALLIGREGKTLLALQYLLRNYVSTFVQFQVLVSLDIANYHENHKRQLEILATKTAKEVAKTGIDVKLDPMNAYDRRIIHTKLSEWRDVETESEGEGENRALVIKPKK
ncbi:MAG: RNA-binding cell elongation regulator Jag/EloR [Acholeplasmataceae bacterium]